MTLYRLFGHLQYERVEADLRPAAAPAQLAKTTAAGVRTRPVISRPTPFAS
jgi:hypothetical protein